MPMPDRLRMNAAAFNLKCRLFFQWISRRPFMLEVETLARRPQAIVLWRMASGVVQPRDQASSLWPNVNQATASLRTPGIGREQKAAASPILSFFSDRPLAQCGRSPSSAAALAMPQPIVLKTISVPSESATVSRDRFVVRSG